MPSSSARSASNASAPVSDRLAPDGRRVDGVKADDVMIVNAARALGAWAASGRDVCFVGIGLPSTAANLARHMYDPAPILVYESGCIGSKPTRLPLSIGDGELGETADAVVGVPEIFAYWLQAGRIDVGFLGGAQIDRLANINSTVIGSYDSPRTRLPGAGGAPEIAASAGQVMVIMRQTARAFVERCDFRSSMGFGDGPGHRERLGLRGDGPLLVITDLGLLEPDPESCELVMTAIHPGVTREQCTAATGWPLRFAADLRETEWPTEHELSTLREIQAA
ncbi:MAG: CoA-transferase subunit beta [Actinobacteria bacterium]|nr:CoA-transferase subunit beta [Actinomycetota bacterium]